MRLKMKQYDEKLTKETMNQLFDEWFDSSEQHFAFKFYAKTGASDNEVCDRVIEDYYIQLIQLGYDINAVDSSVFNETMSEISRHILKLKKEWKVKEKMNEIMKDFE